MSWICPLCKATPIVPSTHNCAQNHESAHGHWRNDQPVNFYKGKNLLMFAGVTGIPPDVLRKYETVMQSEDKAPQGASEWEAFKANYKLIDLSRFSEAEHLATIDEAWRTMIEFCPYDQVVGDMADPRAGNHDSSLTGLRERVFKRLGICYRCDARPPESVTQYGFLPGYRFNPPDSIRETILERCTKPGDRDQSAGYWRGNQDIVNETSICVSRTLRGCGKFPKPEAAGTHYFYAFKFSTQKAGFDTEVHQPQQRRWQPGEKAFPQIVPSEIIAYTPVYKLGSDTGGSAWNWYLYRVESPEWTFTANATTPEKQYLNAELDRLTGGEGRTIVRVTRQEDFAPE